MDNRRQSVWLGGAAALAAAILSGCGERNPGGSAPDGMRIDAHPWAGWSVGTFVRSRESHGAGASSETTETLVALGKKGYTLKRIRSVNGQRFEKEVILHYAYDGYAHAAPGARQAGEETLRVAGRDYACTIWESTWEVGDARIREKSWLAPGVKLPLKIVTVSPSSRLEIQAVKLDDDLNVGGRTLRCVKYEGQSRLKGHSRPVVSWRSLAIPGGVVKSIGQRIFDGKTARTLSEAIGFQGKRRTGR